MKKMFSIILLFIIVLSISSLVLADSSAKYTVQLIKYDPIPAQPGQYLTAYVQVTNIGNSDGGPVLLKMENNFPFQVVDQDDKSIDLGIIKSQQSIVKTIRLRVSRDAVVGLNELKAKLVSKNNVDEWSEYINYIDVRPNQASLAINKVTVSPLEIIPGNEGNISIELKNNEDITLRDVTVKLELRQLLGTTVSDLPLIPTGSATEKQIAKLNPGELNSVKFGVMIYPSAKPGFYKVPLTISFFDDNGKKTVKEEYIGLIVKSEPNLEVYVDKDSINEDSLSGSVSLKFVNKGISDLKFLDVKLLPDKSYSILGKDQEYIGDLDSDDYRTESFNLHLKDKSVPLKVKITYKDANNKDYSFVKEVSVNANPMTSEDSHYFSFIIIGVLILLAIFLIVRKSKKKRK